MSKETYKLIYFDLKGRAHVSRLLFLLGNQEFEDYHIQFQEWPEWKNKLPFQQAPVLEITRDNGEKLELAQSPAIERYLANRFNLYGKNEWEKARIDMMVEQAIDIYNSMVNIYRTTTDNEERQHQLVKAYTESVPASLKLIEKLYVLNQSQSGNSGFLVGDSLSYADIKLVNIYDWLRDQRENVLSHVPKLKEHFDKIRNLPGLKEKLDQTDKQKLTILF